MALTDTAYVERVLIVLNQDKTMKAAHQERRRTVSDGETVIADTMLGAEPLDVSTLAVVLPDSAVLIAENQRLQAELSAALARIQSADAPVVDGVTQSVTPYQARVALSRAGLLNSVEAAVSQSNGELALAWEYATTIERNSPFIAQLGAALGLTSQQIDDLFVTAASVA